MELEHSCRSEYGPLELRVEVTNSLSDFIVYVEDLRLEHSAVHQHAVKGTLESAKEYAALRANEYLNRRTEPAGHKTVWRCS